MALMVSDHFVLRDPMSGASILPYASTESSALYDLGRGTGVRVTQIRQRTKTAHNSSEHQLYFFYDRSALRDRDRCPGAFPGEAPALYRGTLFGDTEPIYEFADSEGKLSVGQINTLINSIIALLAIMPVNPTGTAMEYRRMAIDSRLAGWSMSAQAKAAVTSYTFDTLADESISELERGLLLATDDELKEFLTKEDVLEAYRRNGVAEHLLERHRTGSPMPFSPIDSFLHPSYAFNLSMGNEMSAIRACAERGRFWAFFNLVHRVGNAPCAFADLDRSTRGREFSYSDFSVPEETAIFRMKEAAVENLECLILDHIDGFPPPVSDSFFEGDAMSSLTDDQLLRLLGRIVPSMTERGIVHVRDNLLAGQLDGRPPELNRHSFLTASEHERFLHLMKVAEERSALYERTDGYGAKQARLSIAGTLLVALAGADDEACVEAILMAMDEVRNRTDYDGALNEIGTILEDYTDSGSDMVFSWFARLSGLGSRQVDIGSPLR